jgi:hypothetical protein
MKTLKDALDKWDIIRTEDQRSMSSIALHRAVYQLKWHFHKTVIIQHWMVTVKRRDS